MNMKLQVLQQVEFEDAAAIGDWANDHGHSLSVTHCYDGQTPPAVDAIDGLVVLGGPMSVQDNPTHPWLADVKTYVKQAIDAKKKVLGICLGAQLIAEVLGAEVMRNGQKEIGWFPIHRTEEGRAHPLTADLPDMLVAFHWHGDTFTLPDDATHLFRSEACLNQGFLYGEHVLALQFHLESTLESVKALCKHCVDEISNAPYVQSIPFMTADLSRYPAANKAMCSLLYKFFAT